MSDKNRRLGCCCAAVCAIVFAALAAEAREYSPRVVSPHRADAYSMKTFAEFPRWRGLRGDALAWEVYKYLVDTESGVYHVNEVLEGSDSLGEYRTVRDPVKILNVYGYGYCAIFGPVMAGICEDMGLGKARTITLPDWAHVASEAFYDGRWHYLDIDVRAVFRRADGTLASMADAKRDASLWVDRGPRFFPNDSLDHARGIYRRTPVHNYYGFHQGGHTLSYVLRQGETFTRWWTPQGGRWNHPPEWNREDWLRKLIEQEPRGPKPNHRHFTVHNHANGRFAYRPDLTRRSTDFSDGVYQAENVRPGEAGLTLALAATPALAAALAATGEGHAVFEVRSPYVIVPRVGDLDTAEDDREASVVEVAGRGVRLALSTDGGRTWRDLPVDRLPARVDLTPHVSGKYGYLLRASLRGAADEAVLQSLAITTWVQVAPAALPALAKGVNRMEYRTGDHYGLATQVMEIRSDASKPGELLAHLVEKPADYDPSRKTDRIRGAVTVKVEAPAGRRIAWFSAQGSFRTHQREGASQNRNSIAYAVGAPNQFREIYRADVPTDVDHWHCNARREVRLEKPAQRVYVRYVGDPALNNFHIYAHLLDDARPSARPVRITHAWREKDGQHSQSATLSGPGAYELTAGDEPVNESIEIAAPSD